MTKLAGLTLLFFTQNVLSAELFIPADVVATTSETSRDKTGNQTVYRATVFSGGEEGSVALGLEKFVPNEYGSPAKVIFQKKFSVPALQGFKTFIDKIAKKSTEATYGCCNIQNLVWTNDKRIGFDIKFSDPIFKRGFTEREGKKVDTAQYLHTEVSSFRCQSTSLDGAEPKVSCEKTATEKVVAQ
jgi:hypothetical protein